MRARSPCSSPRFTHASTAPVPPGDRLSYWDRYNADALVGLRTTSQSLDGLLARQTNVALPAMNLADIAGNAHAVERSARLAGMYPKDAVFACHLVQGKAVFIQGGAQFTLAAGDTIVYDTRRPYTLAFLSDMRQFLVDIPVAELEACWGLRVDVLPLLIAPPGGVGAALGAELRRTLRGYLQAPTPDGGIALPACTHALLRTMAQSRLRGPDGPPQSLLHVLAARMHVARHLHDPDLSPHDVARATGVSVRHLNRLFAREGTSLAEHIWAQRTAMAYRELLHPAARPASIGEIALRWGFSSPAHFSRTIAAAHGAPPSALRRKAQG
ncbi:helix-turn-helix domain-containing protein [Massilia sp.]|uniref:helix-turn-helix domain-containing protein n=1 Tax=Massilia sp. TaxID=1882437 RepID=UPI0028A6318E|nr:helix-turn-helix domain-containing protein [Massilia sp.]